jgi:hypothetical protein
MFTEELQFSGTVRVTELLQEQAPEQTGEYAHGQEEARSAGDPTFPIDRQSPAGSDPVHMGMMGHRRAPGVQHQGHADTGAQVSGVGRNDTQGLGGRLEQDAVDHRLVVPGDIADRCGQRKDQVVVLYGQEVGLTGFQPAPGRTALALGAMPVPAGVVGDLDVVASLASQYMTTQCRRAAAFDGRHDPELAETEVTGS